MEFVCEDCLAAGRLQDFDVTTNEGDVGALREQLQQSHPELGDSDLERLSDERRAELEYRTPHMVTWQDSFWPAHCGDYCRFIKEVGRPGLTQLSPEGDGTAFFATHAPDVADLDHAREVWEGIRPDPPLDGRVAYSVGVYLFRCLTCGEPVLLWDCD